MSKQIEHLNFAFLEGTRDFKMSLICGLRALFNKATFSDDFYEFSHVYRPIEHMEMRGDYKGMPYVLRYMEENDGYWQVLVSYKKKEKESKEKDSLEIKISKAIDKFHEDFNFRFKITPNSVERAHNESFKKLHQNIARFIVEEVKK